MKIKTESNAKYQVSNNDDLVIKQAIQILNKRMKVKGQSFTMTESSKDYFVLVLAQEEREHFHCLFLDNQHRLIADERLFSGTIDSSEVHPREVVKRALALNAAAVIFAHNHPSGMVLEASSSDIQITKNLIKCLELFKIRVLDHIIIGCTDSFSFAENGLI
jgi:DNA repair protein RadC